MTKALRLHVLYLPRWYPHRYDPMPGLFIERHGIAVLPHCDISVLYVHADERKHGPVFEVLHAGEEALPVIRIYYRRYASGFRPLDMLVNAWRFVRSHQKGMHEIRKLNGQPDIIHVHVLTRHGLIALWQKIWRKTPYVITEHWTRYLPATNSFKGFFRRQLTAIVARHASAIMPVTANLRDAMINCGLKNSNYRVIPNVVDIQMFSPVERKARQDKTRIIHVSCFDDDQKNISGITRVIRRISEERQDFTVDMIGEGIHYGRLLKYAEEQGIKDSFAAYHGLKENEALARMMQAADFMIMFSRYENLPVVILESYACGVPVISTDVGGISEHMNEELGLLIPPDDEEALYMAINKMLDKHRSYNRQKIRQYAVNHFSQEVIGRQLYGVYESVRKQ
jgi:glycosyltransferase involved in cell wall biosynthesis